MSPEVSGNSSGLQPLSSAGPRSAWEHSYAFDVKSAEPTVWVYFRFRPPPATLDKLLEPSERQFVSSSVAEGVGTTPLQGSCGGQVGEKDLAPFLAQGRGGAVFADALEVRCLRGGVLVIESLLFFWIVSSKSHAIF